MEQGTSTEVDAPSDSPKIPPFLEPDASLPLSQQSVTQHYPEPLESHIFCEDVF
jgi:hypothetical protein